MRIIYSMRKAFLERAVVELVIINTIANLVPYTKRTAEKLNLSNISPPLTNQYAITIFSVKKVEYRTDWSEQTNQLTITLFSPVQSEILCGLVRMEHANCCHGIIEMMRTVLFFYVPHMSSRTTERQCSL